MMINCAFGGAVCESERSEAAGRQAGTAVPATGEAPGGCGLMRTDPRRGVILVAVLWTVALLSALAMATSVTFREFAGIVTIDRDRLRTGALLTAGLETAAGVMARAGPKTGRSTKARWRSGCRPARSACG